MWTTRTIAFAAGVAASIASHTAPGAVIISSVKYNGVAIDFAAGNPIYTETFGDHWNGSLFLAYGENFICGTLKLRANLNYLPPTDYRAVQSTVSIVFSTDEPLSWSAPGDGPAPYGQLYMTSWSGQGGVLAPGTHDFLGTCIVGGMRDVMLNGYANLWFGIPSPAAPASLLCAGLILSIRRRRLN